MRIAISVVAAYASYPLYEKHFLNSKHRIDYSRKTLNHGSPEGAFTRHGGDASGSAECLSTLCRTRLMK
jgi:hypothetical protein